jgi:predicted ribosome quality control (RQC) complex YloA/Tae2 family protein
MRTASLSEALEAHFEHAIQKGRAERLRASLLGQLRRVELARETALADLAQAADAAARASELQLRAELILAYGPSAPPGASSIDTIDYEGNAISIRVDPEATFVENAERLFVKAKRAKLSVGEVREQQGRLTADLEELRRLVVRVEASDDLATLERLRIEALSKRWLHTQPTAVGARPEIRFEGNKIRELMAPGGFTVLYGENATSNDFLTQRIAKPNDIWLHVRGSTSAHVVLQTRNAPDKVDREALLFAARVAVRNSASKHSGYVPVDYTLKKYVRKPRGSAPGFASYTHEKTLHVEPS